MQKKYCPKCDKDLPIDSFGVCKSRSDGRNGYCRVCIVATVKAFRQRKREMKAAIKERQRIMEALERKPSVTSPYVPLSALAKVRNAVRDGCMTRDEIRARTKLQWDHLCEALAELTFQQGVLRIERVGSKREFHLAA